MFIATTPSTDPLQSRAAQATTTSASAGSSTSDANSLGTTFINLLVQELQNQDPTAPMDSTQMVGQMISLNQLDQLAGIHQILTSAFGTSSSAPGATSGSAGGSVQTPHQATPRSVTAAAGSHDSAVANNDASILR